MPKPVIHNERCNGCGKCMELCSEHLFGIKGPKLAAIRIEQTTDGYQVIGCWECGKCAQVCPQNAIKKTLFGVCKIDEKKCTGCGLCVDACPDGLMIFPNGFHTPQKCKKCAACVKHCPQKVFDHR